ncbi:yippee zinc-binding/DNA-binding /Mis18, centromere assembly-domain-containing protein [Abortiporus biennis]|nr:yippee zinc-binding/DNA-binding /Mis18, centromere assembly-domain-containing protein [Abortiporus biennis]
MPQSVGRIPRIQTSIRILTNYPSKPMSSSQHTDTKSQVISTFHDHPTFSCSNCSAVIALQDELISKAFSGRDGRGYLIHSAVNMKMGKKEDRALLTGVHTVADVFCLGCNERLGWYYLKASDQSQKYKEGKYLLEREKLIKDNAWKLDA